MEQQSVERVPFRQGGIPIEEQPEFDQLRSALGRIFAANAVESFLRLLQRKGVPVRDFDSVLREQLLEKSDAALAESGRSAQQFYDALAVANQAQIREFYLTALEAVDLPLREKYKKLYPLRKHDWDNPGRPGKGRRQLVPPSPQRSNAFAGNITSSSGRCHDRSGT
jgi:hypothetical protein